MRRIGIAGIVLAGAGSLGLSLSEGARSQSLDFAARQVPAVASDADTATAAYERNHGTPLAQGLHDQLRRELFGAAVPGRQPGGTDDATNGAAAAVPARAPGIGAGATGDIPPLMSASLPKANEVAPAVNAVRPAQLTVTAPNGPQPDAGAPLQLSPTPPRPRMEEAVAPATPRAPLTARPSAPEQAPVATRGKGGDPQVAEAQRLLAILGYTPGATDGRVGSQTTAAVRAYEKVAGLPQDGRIDAALLAHLRKDMRTPPSDATVTPTPSQAASKPPASFTERVLGGMQRLIARDLDSTRAPAQLAEYCANRSDEWIYDRGQDRMRLCGEINGTGRVAYRPLPGDR
ncbi:MAG: peptidoglycan-binding protein [Rhodospirillales bacterium]